MKNFESCLMIRQCMILKECCFTEILKARINFIKNKHYTMYIIQI